MYDKKTLTTIYMDANLRDKTKAKLIQEFGEQNARGMFSALIRVLLEKYVDGQLPIDIKKDVAIECIENKTKNKRENM